MLSWQKLRQHFVISRHCERFLRSNPAVTWCEAMTARDEHAKKTSDKVVRLPNE